MKTKIVIAGIIIAIAVVILIFYFWESDAEKQYKSCMQDESILAECKCIAGKDLSACDSMNEKEFGLWFKAEITKDRKYCDEILKIDPEFFDYHNCLLDVAKTEADCYAINYSKEPYEINECLAYVHNDASYCTKDMPEKDRTDCIANINKNVSLCYENPVLERKWTCIMRRSSDDSICEEYQKELCAPLLE